MAQLTRPRPHAPAPTAPAATRPRVQRQAAPIDRGSFSWGQCTSCGSEEEVSRAPSAPVVQRSAEPGCTGGAHCSCSSCDPPTAPAEREADLAASSTGRVSLRESASGGEPSPGLRSVLESHAGRGSPLPDAVRQTLERRFDADLSDVRVHADGEAHRLATGLGARAFTYGSDIYFREGAYDPAGHEGRSTLAHEVAHTVQQTGAGATLQRRVLVGDEARAFIRERRAEIDVRGARLASTSRTDVFRALVGDTATFEFLSRDLDRSAASRFTMAAPRTAEDPAPLPTWHIELPSGDTSNRGRARSIAVELPRAGRYRIAALATEPGGADAREVWLTRFVDAETPAELGGRELGALGPDAFSSFDDHAFTATFATTLRAQVLESAPISGARALHVAPGLTNPYRVEAPVNDVSFRLRGGRHVAAELVEWFVVPRSPVGLPDVGADVRFGGRRTEFDFMGHTMVGYRVSSVGRSVSVSIHDGVPPAWMTIVARRQPVSWSGLASGREVPAGEREDAKYEQFFVLPNSPDELLAERVERAGAATGGALVAVRAVHIDRASRAATPLRLFAGRGLDGTLRVFDLTPGARRGDYGSMFLSLVDDYPEGWLHLDVPPNDLGVPEGSRTLETTGRSAAVDELVGPLSEHLATASTVLAVAGLVAVFIPGGQPVAGVLFAASEAAGATSAGLSLLRHLSAERVESGAVALDVLALAGSLAGLGAARFGVATAAGRAFRLADLGLTGVNGLVLADDTVRAIQQVLEGGGDTIEQRQQLMLLLASAIVSGGLMYMGARSTTRELLDVRRPRFTSGVDAPHTEADSASGDAPRPAASPATLETAHRSDAWYLALHPSRQAAYTRWLGELNDETRALLASDAELRRIYGSLHPGTRRLLTLCASPCIIPFATAEQCSRIDAFRLRSGTRGDDMVMREYLHRAGVEGRFEDAVQRLGSLGSRAALEIELRNQIMERARRLGLRPTRLPDGRWVVTRAARGRRPAADAVEYALVRYRSRVGTQHFFEAHHPTPQSWGRARIGELSAYGVRYDGEAAWTLYLRDGVGGSPHQLQTAALSRLGDEIAGMPYSAVRDYFDASLLRANVPESTVRHLRALDDEFFAQIYRTAASRGAPQALLTRVFGTWRP